MHRLIRKIFPLVICLVTILSGCRAQMVPYNQQPNPSAQPIGSWSDESRPTLSDVAEQLTQTVVGIQTRSPGANGEVQQGIGSGVIVTQDGYVLTNHHVAGTAWQVAVVFSDGTQAIGNTVWSNQSLDLAIVKLSGTFPFASMGASGDVRVGEQVIAIGTPLTLQFQHTVTAGIVSARGRTLQIPTADGGQTFMEDLIQTDASINPGNSGGPLINLRGEVIGINTLKISQAEGIGFAIPIDVAQPIVDHFIQDGMYETPYVGVYAYDAEIARYYDEKMEAVEGLFVIQVDDAGPAAIAGLQKGDVLLSADGQRLVTMLDFRKNTFRHKVGETMELTYLRDGSINSTQVKLVKNPL